MWLHPMRMNRYLAVLSTVQRDIRRFSELPNIGSAPSSSSFSVGMKRLRDAADPAARARRYGKGPRFQRDICCNGFEALPQSRQTRC